MAQERIVITGITGFTGSHLAECALSYWNRAQIFGLKRPSSNLSNLCAVQNSLTLVDVDVLAPKELAGVLSDISPTKVFHLAGISNVAYSFLNPAEVISVNTIGTINLFEAIKAVAPKARVHLCSSVEVYGNVPFSMQPMNETTRFLPRNPLGISKVASHFFGDYYHRVFNLDVFTTASLSLTGPRKPERFAESSFARQIALIEKRMMEPIIRVGDLSTIRTFVDVRDAVRAYCILMDKSSSGAEYLVGGDTVISIRAVLDKLIEMSHIKVDVRVDEKLIRPGEITTQIADSSRIRKEFGWKPLLPFEKSLLDLLDYWRERVQRTL